MAKSKGLFSILLRLLALAATLSATIVMATSHETVVVYTIPVKVKYNDTPAFKFFLIVNIIASIYSFLVLFLPSTSMLWSLIVALDMVVTMLLTAGISAAGAVAYVGKKGDSHAGWLPICGQVSKYCDQVGGALISGVAAAVIYMVLILYAIHGVLNPLLLQT